MTKQIDWPVGMVLHMTRKVWGRPGVNLPEWARPQEKIELLYPCDMAKAGAIYIRTEHIGSLRVGDPIQVDRGHYLVIGIDKPEIVGDASLDAQNQESVSACRVEIKFEQYI